MKNLWETPRIRTILSMIGSAMLRAVSVVYAVYVLTPIFRE